MLNVTCIPSGVVPASMVTQWLGARLKPHMLPVRVEPETASPRSPVRNRPVSGPVVVIPRKEKRPFNGEDGCAPNRANPPALSTIINSTGVIIQANRFTRRNRFDEEFLISRYLLTTQQRMFLGRPRGSPLPYHQDAVWRTYSHLST